MKRLLFICLFLLSINGIINAQNHRINVDLFGLGIGLAINSNPRNDDFRWYNLTYENLTKSEKSWGLRASLLQSREVVEGNSTRRVDLSRQIKLITFRKEYLKSQLLGEYFIGPFASLGYLTEGRRKTASNEEVFNNLKSGVHVGVGMLFGKNFHLSKHLLLEFTAGPGIGSYLNISLYDTASPIVDVFSLFSPSFVDVNFCYEF